MPKNHNAFLHGEVIKVAELETLLAFQREWKYHHPLQDVQLPYAGKNCKVRFISYYHGGDCIYELDTFVKDDPPSSSSHIEPVPGFWHEACLTDYTYTCYDSINSKHGICIYPPAADLYVINAEIREQQSFVVVRSKEGSEFLAFRYKNAESEAAAMREVALMRDGISFELRYHFQGISDEMSQKMY